MKWIIPIALILFVCFVPVIEVEYQTIENKFVMEEYQEVEPFSTQVQTRVPYTGISTTAQWVDDGSWDRAANYIAFTTGEYMKVFQSVTPGRYVMRQQQVTRYRTETRTVTEYKMVTKTRTVSKPVIVMRTKRVPLSQSYGR